MSNVPRPPAHLEPYVRVLGADDAIKVFLEFGGAEMYLAPSPKGRSALAQLVGIDKAARLAEVCTQKRVPVAKPWIAQVWKSQGLSIAEIARKLHTTDVTVRKWVKGSPAPGDDRDDAQLTLRLDI